MDRKLGFLMISAVFLASPAAAETPSVDISPSKTVNLNHQKTITLEAEAPGANAIWIARKVGGSGFESYKHENCRNSQGCKVEFAIRRESENSLDVRAGATYGYDTLLSNVYTLEWNRKTSLEVDSPSGDKNIGPDGSVKFEAEASGSRNIWLESKPVGSNEEFTTYSFVGDCDSTNSCRLDEEISGSPGTERVYRIVATTKGGETLESREYEVKWDERKDNPDIDLINPEGNGNSLTPTYEWEISDEDSGRMDSLELTVQKNYRNFGWRDLKTYSLGGNDKESGRNDFTPDGNEPVLKRGESYRWRLKAKDDASGGYHYSSWSMFQTRDASVMRCGISLSDASARRIQTDYGSQAPNSQVQVSFTVDNGADAPRGYSYKIKNEEGKTYESDSGTLNSGSSDSISLKIDPESVSQATVEVEGDHRKCDSTASRTVEFELRTSDPVNIDPTVNLRSPPGGGSGGASTTPNFAWKITDPDSDSMSKVQIVVQKFTGNLGNPWITHVTEGTGQNALSEGEVVNYRLNENELGSNQRYRWFIRVRDDPGTEFHESSEKLDFRTEASEEQETDTGDEEGQKSAPAPDVTLNTPPFDGDDRGSSLRPRYAWDFDPNGDADYSGELIVTQNGNEVESYSLSEKALKSGIFDSPDDASQLKYGTEYKWELRVKWKGKSKVYGPNTFDTKQRPDPECKLNMKSFTVPDSIGSDGGEASFKLRNNGEKDRQVQYTFYVDGQKVDGGGERTASAGKTFERSESLE
ncbi:MAG: hypothetical protein ABEJ03_06450, partial [Candidatus Nanohaloarchaea archaeon]